MLADDIEFLKQLGYVTEGGTLSTEGLNICTLIMVRNDLEAVAEIYHRDLLRLPATQVLLQALWGLKDITVEQAKMALIYAGAAQEVVNKRMTTFLAILNNNQIVVYSRKNRSIKLLVSPQNQLSLPEHVYIDRTRPYSNDLWIREILRSCKGSIMWLDKYFQKEAFEWLLREATAENINSVRIISTVDTSGVDALALADYKRLKKELGQKGIEMDWRVLDRKNAHDFHDRWILDGVELCYNIPSIGSIKSGQRSELHSSPNYSHIKEIFEQYYSSAQPVA
jgi:hypothetical protein